MPLELQVHRGQPVRPVLRETGGRPECLERPVTPAIQEPRAPGEPLERPAYRVNKDSRALLATRV